MTVTAMSEDNLRIGCILMASGLSERYGRNKLLEKLDGREILLHTAGNLQAAGFRPLAVTRSRKVLRLMEREGIACVLHDGPLKSDTIHRGLENLPPDSTGYLFMPADQPLVHPASLQKMAAQFFSHPGRAVRLCFDQTQGSPVIFPAACREALMNYTGDRGGMAVLRERQIPCDGVQAEYVWELWDADTPEEMRQIRVAYEAAIHLAPTE